MLLQYQHQFKLKFGTATVCFGYFLLQLFFVNFGYGVEEDSWGLVVNAKEMFYSNSYAASRLPGHPTHEYLLAWLYPFKEYSYNLLSAISAAFVLYFSILFFEKIKISQPILAALAVGFCPVIFIAGNYTIDYSLSLALLMCAWYLLSAQHLKTSALVLALSIGARITNAVFILPMILFAFSIKIEKPKIIAFVIIAGVASQMLFVPVINKYGLAFFDYTDQFDYPNFAKIIYKATLGVFGLVGFLAVLALTAQSIIKRQKAPIYLLTIYVLCIMVYLRLPQKSAYFIPVIPFLVIHASSIFNANYFRIFCFSMILSGWIFGVVLVDKYRGSKQESEIAINIHSQKIALTPSLGNILADIEKRKIKAKYIIEVIKKTDTLSAKSAIISGWWYNQLLVNASNERLNANTYFVFYCDEDSLIQLKKLNFKIYYLPEQNIYNNGMFKMNCTEKYATDF